MARTLQEFNQNEVRGVELIIDDKDGNDFEIDSAYTTVYNNINDEIVVAKKGALIDGSSILTLIDTDVTANVGEYKILWEISNGDYIFYHATILLVSEI